jgi:mannosyltransferase
MNDLTESQKELGPRFGVSTGWIIRDVKIGYLVVIFVIATVLRVRDLGRFSLWYDEVVTMRLAQTADSRTLIRLLDQIDGTRAPLHPLLLQAWLKIVGKSELAARSFSAVCGVLTVVSVYFLGRRLFDECRGRWAAWFTAVCPPLVYYSQAVRMYSWLVLLSCL